MADQNLPPPPPGITLDEQHQAGASLPPPPPGITLDTPAQAAGTTPSPPPDPNQIVQRGTILPLGRTAGGELKVAWPEAARSFGRGVMGLAEQGPHFDPNKGVVLAAPRTASQNLDQDQLGALISLVAPEGPELKGALGGPAAREIGGAQARQFGQVIKPSIAGRKFATQEKQYYENLAGALHSIIRNKGNFVFGEWPNEVVGELPQSLEEFGHAIGQTKKEIFARYDQLAKEANDRGLFVNTKPLSDMIRDLAKSKIVQTAKASAIPELKQMAAAFLKPGWLTAHEAQEVLEHINAQIASVFRNPNPHDISRASVLAKVSEKLRQDLDYGIERYAGPGYQELRREYGALKAIEADVVRRSGVVARLEKGGGIWGRLGDISSVFEFGRAVATLDPVHAVTAGTIKGITEFVKRSREPNRVITKLFRQAEDVVKGFPGPKPTVEQRVRLGAVGPVAAGTTNHPSGDLGDQLDTGYSAIARPETPAEKGFYSQPGTM
jgi:hypothetical protein